MSGTVYLVGAGPGDPGLLTLRGRECLAGADVVVYDALANPELLEHAARAKEFIYVGKQAGRRTLAQEEINALLVKKAKEGLEVVRLKGGDPYVFGRGAEEALELRKEGIPFEVVPGVTAGVAVPAYAGIPVTHREDASMLTFVTGHEDPAKETSAIDWASLARGGGTLVFYMGVKNLPEITGRLVAHGRPPGTPAAVIQWGTHPTQRVVTGTLADLGDRVREAGLSPPAIIMVGEVVALRNELNWYESLPLFGKTIGVTRSRAQAGELERKLRRLGARVLSLPTLRIEPPEDWGPMHRAVDTLSAFDWILFTSPNAVDHFFTVLDAKGRDARALFGRRICCIGPGTAAPLAGRGIRPDLMPERFTSEAVLDMFILRGEARGKRFLLPRADIAPSDLPEGLRAAGAEVTEVVAYRTLPGEPGPEAVEVLRKGGVDVVTFTSSSTAKNFADMARKKLGGPPRGVFYASIGPETSKAARTEGLEVGIEAAEHTIDGLVAALVERFGRKPA